MASVSALTKGFQSDERFVSAELLPFMLRHLLVVWLLAEVIYWAHSIPFFSIYTPKCVNICPRFKNAGIPLEHYKM